jgi:hypothetical protein
VVGECGECEGKCEGELGADFSFLLLPINRVQTKILPKTKQIRLIQRIGYLVEFSLSCLYISQAILDASSTRTTCPHLRT